MKPSMLNTMAGGGGSSGGSGLEAFSEASSSGGGGAGASRDRSARTGGERVDTCAPRVLFLNLAIAAFAVIGVVAVCVAHCNCVLRTELAFSWSERCLANGGVRPRARVAAARCPLRWMLRSLVRSDIRLSDAQTNARLPSYSGDYGAKAMKEAKVIRAMTMPKHKHSRGRESMQKHAKVGASSEHHREHAPRPHEDARPRVLSHVFCSYRFLTS